MPPKIRQLIADLEAAGFQNRGLAITTTITIPGKLGSDAKHHQVRAVNRAVEDSKK